MGASSFYAASMDRPLRRLLFLAASWTALILVLVGWWGWILRKQAARIVELEGLTGVSSALSEGQWNKTHRMLVWESGTFVLLLLAVSGVLILLYWRDSTRSRSLQAFFASVTHELKTPLTSIRLQAEAIEDSGSTPELVTRLLEDTHRLEGQVEKTLELARIEGGGKTATQALPLKAFLDRSIEGLSRSYGKRIRIQSFVNQSDFVVRADPTAMQIILRNLIENSVRHAMKGSVQVTLQAERQGTEIIFTYEDDGRGFSGKHENLGRLFFRGESSHGAGVGLYLIRMLMERMDGAAVFSSRSKGGFCTALRFRVGD